MRKDFIVEVCQHGYVEGEGKRADIQKSIMEMSKGLKR